MEHRCEESWKMVQNSLIKMRPKLSKVQKAMCMEVYKVKFTFEKYLIYVIDNHINQAQESINEHWKGMA